MPLGGLQFAVKIMLIGETTDLAGWNVAITFDNDSVRCTSALIPERDPAYVFSGKQGLSAMDIESQDSYTRDVVLGGALLNPSDSVTVSNALLCILNFTVLKTGDYNISFHSLGTNTFLIDSTSLDIEFGAVGFGVTAVGAKSKPVALFTYSPENPKSNTTIIFDASTSYDPGGQTIVSYLWDFGDNTTAVNVTAKHAFSENGLYQVNLTIVTAENANATTSQQVAVGSVPMAVFTYLPFVILPNDQVTFNASESSAPNSTIATYSWSFGDNTTFTGNDSTATHKYVANGVYLVNLTVAGVDGVFNSTVLELQVGSPPVPLFNFDPENPIVNDTVTFTASSVGSVTAYVWDFGDLPGNLSIFQTDSSVITHAYYAEQNYTVSLTVYDADGLHSSANQTIFVFAPTTQRPVDYTPQIIFGVVVAVIIVALVVRRVRRKKEEILEI
jgi:PKD repeat protein